MTRAVTIAALVAATAGDVRPASAQPTATVAEAPSPRLRVTVNDGWRYADGPQPGAEAADFADGTWTPVSLPHSWNAVDAYTEAPGYRRGEGWYRRRLTLDPSLRGRRLFLHFEGANQVADVWLNGRHAGRHVGGYTAFTLDVTAHARFDAANVLAVRVDNRHDPDIPPLDADFTFFGGIYRDVWLVAADPLHVTLRDHGGPGVHVSTPEVSERRATVRVRGTLANDGPSARTAVLVHRVLDDAGRELAVLRDTVRVAAGAGAPFDRTSLPIERPRLWSPDDPVLHRVRTEVHDGGRLADRVDVPLGFRWFAAGGRGGFTLNGRPLRLAGTNRHQDRAGLANALPDWAHREDVRVVKATGFDFLRLAHYPQDPAVLAATDALGLAVWEEIPVVNRITPSAAFADNAERMLVEMIRQHRNHPSVLFWGYMNEVLLQKPQPMPPGYLDAVVALARRLDAAAKREDPSRLTVAAVSFDEIDDGTGLQDVPDVLGLNLYFGWYYRTLEGLGPWLDSLHARHPGRPIVVSEYGADSDERIHPREPRAFDFSADFQQRFHEATWPQLAARDWLVGTAVWNQFDFAAKNRDDSKPNLNQKGLLYNDRTPKDVWHYYRARLRAEPVLHLATRDWAVRAGSRAEDAVHAVAVYTNLDQVELFLGDSSLGRRRPENAAARWEVALADGDNRLRARGTRDGRVVEDAATVRYTDRRPFLRDPRSAVRELAVNAGSHYAYTDAGGTVWEADRPYAPGGWGYEGGEPALSHHRVGGTAEDALFQATREGVRAYRFDVPEGTYEVRVGVAEMRGGEPAPRRFGVTVNGQPLLDMLDSAALGRWTAVERTIVVDAVGDGGVVLRFEATAGLPTVSAIHLRRRSP